jgi:hypothetical protein
MSDGPSLIRDFAHELRNAISPSVRRRTCCACAARIPPVLDKSLAHIRRSLDAALQTIDAFVTADRAMSGTLTLETGVYPLGDLFDEAIARIKAVDARETPRFRVARSAHRSTSTSTASRRSA